MATNTVVRANNFFGFVAEKIMLIAESAFCELKTRLFFLIEPDSIKKSLKNPCLLQQLLIHSQIDFPYFPLLLVFQFL